MSHSKALVERKHVGNMTKLFACLDRNRGTRWDVRSNKQASIIRLLYYTTTN